MTMLEDLARAVISELDCTGGRDDGGDWEPHDQGFRSHTDECMPCFAKLCLIEHNRAKRTARRMRRKAKS